MKDRLTQEAWEEIGRVAHQLQIDHGRTAHEYAERVALKAQQEGDEEKAQFWRAVFESLKPRGS